MNIAIYIYDDAEVLDFSGPYEVFSTAARIANQPDVFTPFLVAETLQPVTARAGYRVLPHYDVAKHPPIDVLLVVGGVHDAEMHKPAVIDWIRTQSVTAQHVASVCTGAFLLAKAGVIRDHTVTTHWEDIADLREMFPALTVLENQRWADAGSVTTSAGISAGIDMSLSLVRRFAGDALATATARKMEYDWRDTAA
ncbi:MAG: DJ-1/PfpI family protein [Pseudomonadota bacterium]